MSISYIIELHTHIMWERERDGEYCLTAGGGDEDDDDREDMKNKKIWEKWKKRKELFSKQAGKNGKQKKSYKKRITIVLPFLLHI